MESGANEGGSATMECMMRMECSSGGRGIEAVRAIGLLWIRKTADRRIYNGYTHNLAVE